MKKEKCCPKINKKEWDGRTITWKNKDFLEKRYWSPMGVPVGINHEKVITGLFDEAKKRGYKAPKDVKIFSISGLLRSNYMIEVLGVKEGDKNIVHYKKATFKTKYFKGPYKDLRIPIKQLEKKYKGIKEWVMWYATCPKCAEEQGGDVTVIFARVK